MQAVVLGTPEPVRLFAFGQGGAAFVEAIHCESTGPVADLLAGSFNHSRPDGIPLTDSDLEGVAIVFIAVSLDASEAEMNLALEFASRAFAQDLRVIGIVIHPDRHTPENPELTQALEDQVIDARIDMRADATEAEMQALRWFYAGLRGAARDGTLILEPGWDLSDVVSVLDLPGSLLSLATHAVPKGTSLLTAVTKALEDLEQNGTELGLASGVLLVVWCAPDQVLYAREIREVAKAASDAVQGGLHLTLTARSTEPWGDVGACVDSVKQHGRLNDIHLGRLGRG
ncbi:MAG: hypothetical protein EOP24_06970 [Hyphomicrobiales bacterium]|nr:MAG: hypothetical protein EOP24_06970 [Hyphomicrobiales bacterium]